MLSYSRCLAEREPILPQAHRRRRSGWKRQSLFGGGSDARSYVEADPINATDPSGMAQVENAPENPKRLIGGYATGSNTQIGCQSCVVQTIQGPQWSGGPSNPYAQGLIAEFGGMEGVIAAAGSESGNYSGWSYVRTKPNAPGFTNTDGDIEVSPSHAWVWTGGNALNSLVDGAFFCVGASVGAGGGACVSSEGVIPFGEINGVPGPGAAVGFAPNGASRYLHGRSQAIGAFLGLGFTSSGDHAFLLTTPTLSLSYGGNTLRALWSPVDLSRGVYEMVGRPYDLDK